MTNLTKLLENGNITASAPCRIDFGSFLDAKPVALLMNHIEPKTINIALDNRIRITLKPYTTGRIKIVSQYFDRIEECDNKNIRFDSPYAIIFSICYFFQVAGLQIEVESDFPPKSGLGGSGVLAVAVIYAIKKALTKLNDDLPITNEEIIKLAHDLEDGLRISFTGLQDQAAAVYGGVNLWNWHYSDNRLFTRQAIWDVDQVKLANKHFLVIYSGESHSSNKTNMSTLKSFFSGKYLKKWEEINSLTEQCADYLREFNWPMVINCINREVDIRKEISPKIFTTQMNEIINLGKLFSCGVRFAGAGGGGCLWAVGEVDDVNNFSKEVKRTYNHPKDKVQLINQTISNYGVH